MGILILSGIICGILYYLLTVTNNGFKQAKKATDKKFILLSVYSIISGFLIYLIIWQFVAGLTLYAYENPDTKFSKKIQYIFDIEIKK